MLAVEHVALLAAALASAKLGVIDRRAPLLTLPVSMVFFAVYGVAAFATQVVPPGATAPVVVSQPGLGALGAGGFLVMLVYTLAEATGRLPDSVGPDAPGTAEEQVAGTSPPVGWGGAPGEPPTDRQRRGRT